MGEDSDFGLEEDWVGVWRTAYSPSHYGGPEYCPILKKFNVEICAFLNRQ